MKTLKRIRYYTLNSWNQSTAPAYNLKIHKVINSNLQDKVFELMDCENFYDEINELITHFNIINNFEWQAGFNGRSGGYLVLYRGGKHEDGRVYSQPGRSIEDNEVPGEVLRAFRTLALSIIQGTEYKAKNCVVENETYSIQKTRKIIV
ncbi:MAG: hypothetical protein EHM66_00440 [Deltaproteobacteria bacterium]|nr:MAG: hypothetical protein EHM66_00440 [Deltaproteobacteria bacterium]